MKKLVLVVLLIAASPAFAQQPPPYAPPDAELWQQMSQAFSRLNIPLEEHQRLQQIMMSVQAEAAKRAAAAQKPPEKK